MHLWNHLEEFLDDPPPAGDGSCRKIFHGPHGQLPGLETLIIDKMAQLLFVISYKPLGEELAGLLALLKERFPDHLLRIQERQGGQSRDVYLSEGMPDQLVVKEGETSYYIHPQRGQNLGFFPDMINGRTRLKAYLKQEKQPAAVLNLFSYTCAFSVVCLQAGAAKVDNWDMNHTSLKIGKRNHRLNGLDPHRGGSRYFAHDILKSLGKVQRNGPYDLIILDPPPYQGRSFTYTKDYPRLLRRMPLWLKEGGAGFFCLNAADCGREEFRRMLAESLPGDFALWEEVVPPPEFTGRYPDRGLKSYFLSGWNVKKNS